MSSALLKVVVTRNGCKLCLGQLKTAGVDDSLTTWRNLLLLLLVYYCFFNLIFAAATATKHCRKAK